MSADPISLITAPARLGLRLAVLPLRVLRGAAGAVLGHDAEEEVRFAPTAEPSTAGERPQPSPGPRTKPKPKPEPAPGTTSRTTRAVPGPGPEIHVEAPWPDYDDLTLSALLLRIEQATPAEKAMVRLYERQSANREAVLHETAKP